MNIPDNIPDALIALSNRIRERCNGIGSAAMTVPGQYAKVLTDAANKITEYEDAARKAMDEMNAAISILSLLDTEKNRDADHEQPN